jgi:hypothetical protein
MNVIIELATLPREALLNADGLAAAMGRHKKTIQRSVRRGELPPPFLMGGRQTWLVGAVLDHFAEMQRKALETHDRRMISLDKHRTRAGL